MVSAKLRPRFASADNSLAFVTPTGPGNGVLVRAATAHDTPLTNRRRPTTREKLAIHTLGLTLNGRRRESPNKKRPEKAVPSPCPETSITPCDAKRIAPIRAARRNC